MVLTLSSLKPEFKPVCHQILTASTNPTMKDTYKRLLNMDGNSSSISTSTGTPLEALALVSQTLGGNQGQFGSHSRPHCNFCKKKGHEEDKCWKKNGRPAAPPTSQTSQAVHVAQSDSSPASSPPTVALSATDYEAFLKFQTSQ